MIYDVMLESSIRLYNALLIYCINNRGKFQSWREYAETTPIHVVRVAELNKMRNVGMGTIQEFINLRNATA